jgi:uncharacterized protein (UPF0332 family)|tara:strand:- start:596 stop:1021 length:426 start_codon:yes stop_codon:yes gene_type:complete
MNLEKLLEENKIEKIEAKEFDMSLAERDLKVAKDMLNSEDFDWALSIAYNAVLQAARALMFSLGYRPKGKNQHKTVFEFLELAKIDNELTNYFDSTRKTRHIAVYDQAEYVSKSMAEEAVNQSGAFVQKIRTFVQKIRTTK